MPAHIFLIEARFVDRGAVKGALISRDLSLDKGLLKI